MKSKKPARKNAPPARGEWPRVGEIWTLTVPGLRGETVVIKDLITKVNRQRVYFTTIFNSSGTIHIPDDIDSVTNVRLNMTAGKYVLDKSSVIKNDLEELLK